MISTNSRSLPRLAGKSVNIRTSQGSGKLGSGPPPAHVRSLLTFTGSFEAGYLWALIGNRRCRRSGALRVVLAGSPHQLAAEGRKVVLIRQLDESHVVACPPYGNVRFLVLEYHASTIDREHVR
jgi:hypothetical protein